MKAFIIYDSLRTGEIEELEGTMDGEWFQARAPGRRARFHRRDFRLTREEAVTEVNSRIQAAIKHEKKRIDDAYCEIERLERLFQ